MSKKTVKNIPKFRFPEFRNELEWEEKKVGDVCNKPYSGGTPSSTTKEYYGGSIPFIRSAEIDKLQTKLFLTNEGLKNSSAKLVKKGDVLVALYGANSGDVALSKIDGAINQAILCLNSKDSNPFLYQYLASKKDWIVAKYIQGGQGNLSGEIVKSVELNFPKQKEQQKVADCLNSIDSLISAQNKKVKLLKEHKEGLLQNLFPQDGKNIPKLRFSEFQNAPEWEDKRLGDLLDYEQPTKYLVSNTNYDDSFATPVLTAGKTFILGYTDETKGIFGNPLPVIIFDDFTTATKFVDFPFKAKSSAMKILKAKNDFGNMKVIFELIQTVKFQADEHKRYWISEYQNLTIKLPEPDEQQKIANSLSSIDEQINFQTKKTKELKEHKKALLQQLFPSNEVA